MSNCEACGQPLPKPMTFHALAPQEWFLFTSDDEAGARGRGPYMKVGYDGAYFSPQSGYWVLQGKIYKVLVMKVEKLEATR